MAPQPLILAELGAGGPMRSADLLGAGLMYRIPQPLRIRPNSREGFVDKLG
jgi:hypothetical protein